MTSTSDRRRGLPFAENAFGRRQLLKRALLVCAGLATGLGAVRSRAKNYGGYRGLQVLGPYQADVVYAFAEAVLPTGPGFPSIKEARVIERMDEEIYFVEDGIRSDFMAAIMLVEMLPLTFGYASRFSRLSIEKRVAFLRAAKAADTEVVNVVTLALAVMVRYLYYGHPSAWAAVGYDGPFGRIPAKLGEQRRHYLRISRQAGAS